MAMDARHERDNTALLLEQLNALETATKQVRAAVPLVNDEEFTARAREGIAAALTLADNVLAAHRPEPKGDMIGVHLATLADALADIHMPPADPDLGTTTHLSALELLHARLGQMTRAVLGARKAALKAGLVGDAGGTSLTRAGHEGLLRGMAKRVRVLEAELAALKAEMDGAPRVLVQQNGLLNIAFRDALPGMKADIAGIKSSLSLGENVPWGRIVRLVESVAGHVRALWTGLRPILAEMGARVANGLRAVGAAVERVVRGVRAVNWRVWGIGRRSALGSWPAGTVADDAPDGPPPQGFSQAAVEEMVLAGREVPADWVPFVTQLRFGRFGIAKAGSFKQQTGEFSTRIDLHRLAGFRRLRRLALGEMEVRNLGPLRNCTGLQELYLANTQVSDLAPLRNCTGLQELDLANTQVSDLAPLRNCAGLRVLYLANTQVSDLAPLQACTWLERLDLDNTKVSAAEVRRFREAWQRAGLGEVEIFGVS
jgi:hypothetical protein